MSLLLTACGVFVRPKPDVWGELPKARYPIPPYARWLKGLKICLDPGHGGQSYLPGYKRGPTGLQEAEVNLRVALYLREFLEGSGAIVVMTRQDDSFVGLRERCEIANRAECDLFISLHHNASDRETANYTSTWYHFTPDDSPASLDLARYLQSGVSDALRLPEYPPTGLYSDQLMYRSGFGVLRNIHMPGALMEASFHSNRQEEKKLAQKEYNRREAYGYFLGLAQYAAGGFPHAELLDPPEGGQTADKTPLLRLQLHDGLAERGIWGKERLQIFTEAVIVRLDGERIWHQLDKDTGIVTYQVAEPLSNDWHEVQADLMNAYKNHNLPRKLRFQVAPPPAYASVRAWADTITADGISYVPLEVQAWDADRLTLADGSIIGISADRGTLESSSVALSGGRGVVDLHSDVLPGKATVLVAADSAIAQAVVYFDHTDDAMQQGRIRDALNGQPLPQAQVVIQGAKSQRADDGRYLATRLPAEPRATWVSAQGYFDHLSQADLRPGQATIQDVDLYPVDDGILFGQTYILDPQFGGSEPGEQVSQELSAADLNLAVCRYLREYLESAGARVIMIRSEDVYISPNERVLQTNEAETGWYLRMEHRRAEQRPLVVGYSASADEYAKRLGRAVLQPLSRWLDLENGGMVDTGDYEIVQANKNALSVAFNTIGSQPLGMAVGDTVLLRREAYFLYRGIAGHQGLEGALEEALQLQVVASSGDQLIKGATATVDGQLPLSSDPHGQIDYYGLRPREYLLRVTAENYLPVEKIIAVPGQTILTIRLESER